MAATIFYGPITCEGSLTLPTGWNYGSGSPFSVVAGSVLAGTNCLTVSATGTSRAIYGTQDGHSGNIRVTQRMMISSPGASSTFELIGRLSDPNPANLATSTTTSYRLVISMGTAAANWSVIRQNGTTANALNSLTTFGTALSGGVIYDVSLVMTGDASLPGTRVSGEIQAVTGPNAGKWLTSAAAWSTTQVSFTTPLDNGSIGTGGPLLGQGYSGFGFGLASGATGYADNFTLTDYLDPLNYTKVWADDSGWTTGVGTATANVFDVESALVITGNATTQQVISAVNDRQWGDTCTYNVQWKCSATNTSIFFFAFRVRGYQLRFNGQTGVIELLDAAGASVSTVPLTNANWTVARPYRVVAVGTDTLIRFAVIDTVTGNYLQSTGAFASTFAWAFDATITTPGNPAQYLSFYCNLSAGVKFSVGTFTAGPAGTPSATPNPASVSTGGAVAITRTQFDGVNTVNTITSGGGTYAYPNYTAPGTAGSANVRFAAQYRPAQTVDVPITISTATATTYTLTPPSPSSGVAGIESGDFTVTPNGIATGNITITPSGGGLTTPIVLSYSGSAAAQTFSFTPTTSGTVTLTPTNSAGLTNPAAVTYASTSALSAVYVASNGNDGTGDGSIGAPFLTTAKALAATSGGATINLRGGDTFTATIPINATTGGRTVQSYGTGRAIVATSTGHAVSVTNVAGVTIDNLQLSTTGGLNFVPVLLNCTDTTRRGGGVTISNCIMDGNSIASHGIKGNASTSGSGGYDNLTIFGNEVKNTLVLGIGLSDGGSGGPTHYSNARVHDNHVHDILGAPANFQPGVGIVMGSMDTTVAPSACYNNHVHHIGINDGGQAFGGPGGMFPVYSDGVQFYANVIHDIYCTHGRDGCGLDIDLGNTNITMERNYVYNTGGAGFLMFSDLGGHVFRWNVLLNTGTANAPGPAGLAGLRIDALGGLICHNNLVHSASTIAGALTVTAPAKCANKAFYNNTFVSGAGVATVDLPSYDSTFKLEGNSYTSGTAFFARAFGITMSSLGTFRSTTNRETGHGFTVAQPYVGYGSAAPAITDPATIPGMAAVGLPSGSPLSLAGLNLQNLYSINPGTLDFLGNSVTAPYSVGGVASSASTNATGYTLAPSPGTVNVGSPVTITATLTGGTTLSSTLVISLIDSLASTISGNITIASGSTTGTATITPLTSGEHNVTATHTGGGFSGNPSTSYTANGVTSGGGSNSLYVPSLFTGVAP